MDMNLRKIIREEIDDLSWIKDIQPRVTYEVLVKIAKTIYGYREDGDAFYIPYEYGTMSVFNMDNNRCEVTWYSGGEVQDTDTYPNETVLRMLLNSGGVLKEEVDDFDWVKETSYEDYLDSYFSIERDPETGYFKFEGMDNQLRKGEEIPRFTFPWTYHTHSGLKRIAYDPAKKFDEIYQLRANDLFKIVNDKSVWGLGYFKNRKIAKSLLSWKESRVEGLKKYYPRMWKYYKSEYLS